MHEPMLRVQILFDAATLGCEHASMSLRMVSRNCVSPQPQKFQNDVISIKKNWLTNQILKFFIKNNIFIQNSYYHMTHDHGF